MVGVGVVIAGVVAACLGAHATPLGVSSVPKIQVDPRTRMFSDSNGVTRIFHGVNAVTKQGDLVPSVGSFDTVNSLGPTDAAMLSRWGFNVVRLGVLWQGVMPTVDASGNGIINATYLEQVKDVVNVLAAEGIYTILDAHQDNLSLRTCGEGVPTWLYDKMLNLSSFNRGGHFGYPFPLPFHLPLHVNGNPSPADCQKHAFFLEGLTMESDAAWRALYSQPEVHEQFRRSWAAVAEALGDVDGVLGYELLNEPAATTTHGLNDAVLLPLYRKGIEGIRQYDKTSIVFYEPLVLENFVGMFGRVPRLPEYGPEGVEHVNRQAYAYHNYCAPTEHTSSISMLCKTMISRNWKGFAVDLKQYKVAGFLTEFGSIGDDPQGHEVIERVTAGADEQLQSWAYWTYKSNFDITTQNPITETFFNPDGSLQQQKINRLARVYARSIAGVPSSMHFERSTSSFQLQYILKDGPSHVETEIFLNQAVYYPNGFDVTMTPEGIATTTLVNDCLIVTHLPAASGQSLTVAIIPK